jgi:hypothetical protein
MAIPTVNTQWGGSLQPERVLHPPEVLQRTPGKHARNALRYEDRPAKPREGPPPPRGQSAVGEQQQQVGTDQTHGRYPQEVVDPREHYREGDRAGPSDAVETVDVRKAAEHPQQADREADPTYGVLGAPGGDQGPHHGEGQERHVDQQASHGEVGSPAGGEGSRADGYEEDDGGRKQDQGESAKRPRETDRGAGAHLRRYSFLLVRCSFTAQPYRRIVSQALRNALREHIGTNFLELRTCEVRRSPPLKGWVNSHHHCDGGGALGRLPSPGLLRTWDGRWPRSRARAAARPSVRPPRRPPGGRSRPRRCPGLRGRS